MTGNELFGSLLTTAAGIATGYMLGRAFHSARLEAKIRAAALEQFREDLQEFERNNAAMRARQLEREVSAIEREVSAIERELEPRPRGKVVSLAAWRSTRGGGRL